MALRKSTAAAESSSSAAVIFRTVLYFFHDLPQPNRRLIIPHPARRLFHIRLKVVDRISVTRQPFFRQPVKLRLQKRARMFFRPRQDFCVEVFKQRGIARQEPPVEKREMKFRVVFFDALAFFQRAPSRTHTEIPSPKECAKTPQISCREILFCLVAPK